MITRIKGMADLFKEVINQGLCTKCGACIGACPYTVFYAGKLRMLDYCDRTEGNCYRYCPRTITDLDAISEAIFSTSYSVDELGTVKDIVIARAKDDRIRERAQYGGAISSLISFAFDQSLIDRAILTRTDNENLPAGYIASKSSEVINAAGSNYIAYPALEALNRIPSESRDRLAIVVTPCQAMALAKMKAEPPEQRVSVANVRLTIGLFCTWALDHEAFCPFLKTHLDTRRVKKFDITPPPANRLDVYFEREVVSFPLEEIRNYVMPACTYCTDMTAEFADISVGAVEGLDGWNTLIIRSMIGADIVMAAEKAGKLDIKDVPLKNLQHLKESAMLKKKRAMKAIVSKTGDKNNLLYLNMSDALRDKLLG